MEKPEKKKKYFIITKSKEEYITLELKDFFEDPNKYLQNKTRFIVGDYSLNKLKINKSLLSQRQNHSYAKLKLKNNELDLEKNVDCKSSLRKLNKNKLNNSKRAKRCISALNANHGVNIDPLNPKNQSRNLLNSQFIGKRNVSSSLLNSIHYEIKNSKEIIDLFNKFSPNNKNTESIKLLSSKTNDFINHKFIIQEKNLKINNEEKKSFNDVSKFLAQKCKKTEENLLLNKIENYNLKKQLVKYFEQKKLLSEKLGKNYWICNLRRSKYNHKINYVNTGRNDKEPWEQIVDAGDMEIEYIKNPTKPITIDNIRRINNLKYIKRVPKLESFNGIKVEGINLFKQEYNNFINNIDKKDKIIKCKLYKDPLERKSKSIKQLVFKENYRPLLRAKKNLICKGN